MDVAARLNWIDRVCANAKAWNETAEMLNSLGKGRQVFVAASFAAEEFAKAFLLWYTLATRADEPPGLRKHEAKQAIGSLLALIRDAPQGEAEFWYATAEPFKYLKEVDDADWEMERRHAAYEEEGDVPEPNVGYVWGIALDLEDRVGRLIDMTKRAGNVERATLARCFQETFLVDQ